MKQRTNSSKKRAVTAAFVAVMAPVLLGFAALATDVGAIYNARADLQTVSDASALAAAQVLSVHGGGVQEAFLAAQAIANSNKVMGRDTFTLASGDVEFLHASLNESGGYTFSSGGSINSVRVTSRLASGHANGPLELYFARIFGMQSTELEASATAIMGPRDIAIVADLSASHNDDSELKKNPYVDINLKDVWSALMDPGGVGGGYEEYPPGDPFWEGPEAPEGPAWGYMKKMGWGNNLNGAGYNPNSDPGMVELDRGQDFPVSIRDYLLNDVGYNKLEVDAIMSSAYDYSGCSTCWPARPSIALGLAHWYSGIEADDADGKPPLWKTLGIDPSDAGNGNTKPGDGETVWIEKFGTRTLGESKQTFQDWIAYGGGKKYGGSYGGSEDFHDLFGLKTFTNYLLERKPGYDDVPELAGTPHEPMLSVQNAVKYMMDTIRDLDSADYVSLEIYGLTIKHEVDLGSTTASAYSGATGVVTTNYPTNFDAVAGRLSEMQAGHYDRYTNMGGGIEQAIETLTGPNARDGARKIMIVLTDGVANIDASGNYTTSGGKAYAKAQAAAAAAAGIKIYTVSVSSGADTALMQEVADLGNVDNSEEQNAFFAGSDVGAYGTQLAAIFKLLGSRRSLELVE